MARSAPPRTRVREKVDAVLAWDERGDGGRRLRGTATTPRDGIAVILTVGARRLGAGPFLSASTLLTGGGALSGTRRTAPLRMAGIED